MLIDRTIVQAALEALDTSLTGAFMAHHEASMRSAAAKLRAALAAPQPEPVAWLARDRANQLFIVNGGGPHDIFGGFPVYASPPAPLSEPTASLDTQADDD